MNTPVLVEVDEGLCGGVRPGASRPHSGRRIRRAVPGKPPRAATQCSATLHEGNHFLLLDVIFTVCGLSTPYSFAKLVDVSDTARHPAAVRLGPDGGVADRVRSKVLKHSPNDPFTNSVAGARVAINEPLKFSPKFLCNGHGLVLVVRNPHVGEDLLDLPDDALHTVKGCIAELVAALSTTVVLGPGLCVAGHGGRVLSRVVVLVVHV